MTRRRRSTFTAPPPLPESMLDLIWILLFFFLTISTVRREERERVLVEAAPYAGRAEEKPEPKEFVHLRIGHDGMMELEGREVAREELRVLFEERQNTTAGNLAVVIEVDREARVEDLLGAEDAVRASGGEAYVKRAKRGDGEKK